MALSIKNPEADRLARELARATGESITEAVLQALRQRLVRETGWRPDGLEADIGRIQKRLAQHPVLDTRSPDEVLGYDAHGLPG